jgi:hypothetical protein
VFGTDWLFNLSKEKTMKLKEEVQKIAKKGSYSTFEEAII